MEDSRTRFSDRVERYVKYRPGYPDALVASLTKRMKGIRAPIVADLGSGTGKLTKPLLEKGCRVYAVEPNREMREYAEADLAGFDNFVSLDGEAAATGLKDGAFDLVTVGQAFHWFAHGEAVEEFRRILKPGRGVALVWNDRFTGADGFHDRYEELIKTWCPEYSESSHKQYSAEKLSSIFTGWGMEHEVFANYQEFDFDGLRGRLESSSYCPLSGSPGHDDLMDRLKQLFDEQQKRGFVRIKYRTLLFYFLLDV